MVGAIKRYKGFNKKKGICHNAIMVMFFTICIAPILSDAVILDRGNSIFGIKWGMSVDEVKTSGIELKPIRTEGRLEFFGSRHLPENFPIASEYVLVFDKDYKLQSIAMLSKKISDNLTGKEGKNVYLGIKNSVEKKYGSATDVFEDDLTKVNTSLNGEDFYQCLKLACMWNAYFESKTDSIKARVELFGQTKGIARVMLSNEGSKWEIIRKELVSIRTTEDLSYLNYASGRSDKAHNYFSFYENDETDDVIERCKKLMGKHGWVMVKACVDQDIEAKKALEKY
jgi:hypothetical protein